MRKLLPLSPCTVFREAELWCRVVCLAGVEPTTFGSGGQRSVQLSYRHMMNDDHRDAVSQPIPDSRLLIPDSRNQPFFC